MALTVLSLEPNAAALDFRILATDIDPRVVEEGRIGVYPAAALAEAPGALRQRYFAPAGDDDRRSLQASEELRRLVVFRTLNLNGVWPMPGKFHAIFCRNVVIYFDESDAAERCGANSPPNSSRGGDPLHRSFRARHGAGGGAFRQRRRHRLSAQGRRRRMNPVRVLVVDNSATMRGLISAALSEDPGIEVIGQASDPLEARAAIKALNPDVMTLDVEMPKMDGLEFLEKVMRLRPFPVVMVSSLTARGRERDNPRDGTRRHRLHRQADDRTSQFVRRSAGASPRRRRSPAATPRRRAIRCAQRCRPFQARRQGRGDRRVDRRGRGADLGDRRLSRELPANLDHRAYAEPRSPGRSRAASTG